MPDAMARAQERAQEFLSALLEEARRGVVPSGASDCVTCGAPIPSARQTAVPWAIRCTDCQAAYERTRR